MSRVTDSGFPAWTEPYRMARQGSMSGINTPSQRLEERLAMRFLDSDWPSAQSFIEGKLEMVGGFTGTMIRRVPLRHPTYDNLLATGYSGSSLGFLKGATDATNSRLYRTVEVTFSPPDYNLDGQKAFITESTSPSTRSLIAPPSIFLVNGLAPTVDHEFEVPGTNLSLTLHQLDSLPLATYALYQRRVNNADFYGYEMGTLLYLGPSSNRTRNVGATLSYEVTHEFVWSSIAWNYVFTPAGTLSEMTYAGGTRRYPLANFQALFT